MTVGRFSVALVISLAVHAVLLAGIGYALGGRSAVDEAAKLDLAKVELSFAEKEDESAPIAPVPMSVASREEERVDAKVRPLDFKNADRSVPSDDFLEKPLPSPTESPSEMTPAPALAPREARLDAPPSPKRNIVPKYPDSSRRKGEQGAVVVEIVVSEQGRVSSASVVVSSGFPDLDEAALRAVKEAEFTPAKSGGRPVSATARLKLDFRLVR